MEESWEAAKRRTAMLGKDSTCEADLWTDGRALLRVEIRQRSSRCWGPLPRKIYFSFAELSLHSFVALGILGDWVLWKVSGETARHLFRSIKGRPLRDPCLVLCGDTGVTLLNGTAEVITLLGPIVTGRAGAGRHLLFLHATNEQQSQKFGFVGVAFGLL